MKKLNFIKKIFSKENLKVSLNSPSKFLPEFLDGLITQVPVNYIHES